MSSSSAAIPVRRPRARPNPIAVEAAPSALPFDVLESKLRAPELRPGVASRPGLVNRLRAERAYPLVAIVGAAGYGKSTLIAQWLEREDRASAWVTVDAHDNDPLVLLRHVAAALDRIEPLPERVLETLAAPSAHIWRTSVPRLAGAVAAFQRPFLLVLDDVDLLGTREALDVIKALADNLPAESSLVLAGRVEPRLPLTRMRAAGRLLQLGTGELALGRREAELLLRGSGAAIEQDEVARVIGRSEGWATGLLLSAHADDSRGGLQPLAEYFEAEHLSQLEPERLAFLCRTSMLERLTGPLCDALLGGTAGALELESLARANLFLTRDGDGGYRYHPLFREALRRELDRREPGLVLELHARAADWYEAHGDRESALGHALAAGQAARAAALFADVAVTAFAAGRDAAVEDWLAAFAAAAPIEEYPAVGVLAGWIHALRGRAEDAERCLAAAEQGRLDGAQPDGSASARPWVSLLRAALCAQGPDRMAEDVASALAELPSTSPWRPLALVLDGIAALLRADSEAASAAFVAADEAAALTGAAFPRALAHAERALLALAADDADAAEGLAAEAHDLLEETPEQVRPTSGIFHAARARAYLRQGRWSDVPRELRAAEPSAGSLGHALPWLAVQTHAALAAVYVALRDRNRARTELTQLELVVERRPDLGALSEDVDAVRVSVQKLLDEREEASTGLTAAELRLLPLLATHLSFREIGERLFVSRNTIKTQAISVYRKLSVSSRSAAIDRAMELSLLDLTPTHGELTRAG
jgi:LuxR family transcriptional regulator, maltose regulon positive regulatory protein